MSTESEEAMIGCVLIGADPTTLGVQPDDLYQPRNITVWQTILDLHRQGVRPDLQAVAAEIPDQGIRLLDLAGRATVPQNADHHAEHVLADAARRRIHTACIAAQQASEDHEPAGAIIDNLRGALDQITTESTRAAYTMADLYQPVLDQLTSGNYQGLSTPWPDLDKHIYGLQPGRLYVIAARPGVGKTVAALNLAMHMSITHHRWTYFASLEMPAVELGVRAMANATGISIGRLSTGNLTRNEWDRLDQARTTGFGDLNVQIADTSTQTMDTIREGARKLAQRNQLGLVIVDYLQLMDAPGRTDRTRNDIIGSFTRALKMLAKDLQVPVIALSQLNRNGGGTEPPELRDLRESGSIEQDADVVLMMHPGKPNPDGSRSDEISMLIRKNRSGSQGEFQLTMYGQYAALRQLSDVHHRPAIRGDAA